MDQVDEGSELDFMGILGSKWVEKPDNYNKLEKMLNSMEKEGGKARFLLANWKSNGYEKLLNHRNRQNLSLVERADHYRDYLHLHEEYDSLEVRLYSNPPTFRAVFINDRELGVSRYRYRPANDEEFNRARKIPHVVIDEDAKFTLQEPFSWTFQHIWEKSEKINHEHVPTLDDSDDDQV
jgi:hypothetical protein